MLPPRAAAGPCSAARPAPQAKTDETEQFFASADKNNDGKITFDEYKML